MARLRLEVHIHTEKGLVKHAYVRDGVDQAMFGQDRVDDFEKELTGMAEALVDWWHSTGYGKNLAESRFTTGPDFEAAENRSRNLNEGVSTNG